MSTNNAINTNLILVQHVYTITGVKATGSTAFTLNNSTPTNTEGTQFQTLSITPLNSNNVLVIEFIHYYAQNNSSPKTISCGLFQDSTSNALATFFGGNSANVGDGVSGLYIMTAGTTSSTTFKIRTGTGGGDTITFNGLNNTAYFNGTLSSIMRISEFTS